MSFNAEEIERILKEKTPGTPVGVVYCDVVFLRDGVIFRGTIVEQVLGERIILQTENDYLLSLHLEEIWKIVKEKRLAEGIEKVEEEKPNVIDDLKSQLQILLVSGAETQKREYGAEDIEVEQNRLEEEIARLKDEIEGIESDPDEEQLNEEERVALIELQQNVQSLQEQVKRLEEGEQLLTERIVTADQRAAELEAINREFQKLIDELLETTKGMWTEEIVGEAKAYKEEIQYLKEDFQDLVSDLLEAVSDVKQMNPEQQLQELEAFRGRLEVLSAEMRDLARARRQEDVDATQYVLGAMITGEIWLNPDYQPVLSQLSTVLPRHEREVLFEENKRKDAWSSTGMNLIPILALGSWKQGDTLGAITAGIAGILGLTNIYLGTAHVFPEAPESLEDALLYVGIGFAGAGWAFSLIEPFIYSHVQNRKLGQALGLVELEPKKKLLEYTALKRFYLLLDVGTALTLGPRLEIGSKILPDSTVGVHVLYPYLGLAWQLGHMDNSDFAVLPESIGTGINASYFFRRRNSPHRWFVGCNVDFTWTWLLENKGTINEVNVYKGVLFILPAFGYRLRYASGFFLSLGLSGGFSRMLWNEWWYKSTPDVVNQGEIEHWPMVLINFSLGWEIW
jgi:hypothetical protein